MLVGGTGRCWQDRRSRCVSVLGTLVVAGYWLRWLHSLLLVSCSLRLTVVLSSQLLAVFQLTKRGRRPRWILVLHPPLAFAGTLLNQQAHLAAQAVAMVQSVATQHGSESNPLDTTGLCLLSLDGGGVRGLSTLYILKGLMMRLNHQRQSDGLNQVKPCDVFDLIGGTSTGG